MAEVLFCTKEDIVRRSPILDGNIDADKIIPALHLSQTQYLREIIGTELYDKYVTDITALVNNGTVIPAAYKSLLDDYIKPILIHLCTAEFLKTGAITVSNKGIYMHNSENSSNVTSQEIKEIVQIERDRAESYTQRFLDYMSFNAAGSYPEWFSNSNADVSPNYESYTIDWVL
tara:strand:+ start:375 stop:896 length:522 start_codon:yes stop_codon:yes gene_type:complete